MDLLLKIVVAYCLATVICMVIRELDVALYPEEEEDDIYG